MKKIVLITVLTLCFFSKISANSKPIHVVVSGKGNPIIFIPGFTVSGEIWKPVVTQLEKKYECHVVTLAGFAGKEPISFPWLPKVNTALEKYILKNKLKKATVIGHSLGGTLASWLASREQLDISRIIIVDGLPATGALMIPNFNPDNLVYKNPMNDRQLAMSNKEFEKMAENMSKMMSLNTTAQERIRKWMIIADRKTYVYGYTDYLKLDVRENLKKIKIPVTIIAADTPYGKEMATKTYKEQYENLKEYELIIASNSAHFIMLDQPEWFLQKIKTILSVE